MNNQSVNNIAWIKLFDKYNILEKIVNNGYFTISAEQIREYREPRLMAKYDHANNLPEVFIENNLSILPISRGDYILSHFDAYHRFESSEPQIIKASLPTFLQSLDAKNITSETTALNCAFASGIIADFLEDTELIATVSGRMSSGVFSFNIKNTRNGTLQHVNVNNSQLEIDAAYEGISSLALFEAKRDISEDFLIRQLYYPFRLWRNRISKKIRPIFLVYSNGIYRLYEYEFANMNDYNSLRLIKQKNYSIEETDINVSDIQTILDRGTLKREPAIPFPQADRFERVINLCEIVSEREMSRMEVTEEYDFDVRQTNYYTDAARYLGLLEKTKYNNVPYYKISSLGNQILNMKYKRRQLAYCERILAHRVFNETLRLYFRLGVMPSNNEIVDIMKQTELYQVESESTYIRRSSTVRGWINWIISLINE